MTNDIEITQIWPQEEQSNILDVWAYPNPLIIYGAELRFRGKVYQGLSFEPQPSSINGYAMTRFTGKIIG